MSTRRIDSDSDSYDSEDISDYDSEDDSSSDEETDSDYDSKDGSEDSEDEEEEDEEEEFQANEYDQEEEAAISQALGVDLSKFLKKDEFEFNLLKLATRFEKLQEQLEH